MYHLGTIYPPLESLLPHQNQLILPEVMNPIEPTSPNVRNITFVSSVPLVLYVSPALAGLPLWQQKSIHLFKRRSSVSQFFYLH